MKSALLLLCSFLMIANANAMGKKSPASPDVSPSPSPSPSATLTIDVNPDNLRQYMLANSDTLVAEMYNVYTAKDTRDSLLGKLFPSVNLGAVLGSTTGSGFVLSTVSILVPFLVPDNWINLKEGDHQLSAEEYSYLILELNTYASTYALYETVINDYDALDVLNDNYHTLYLLYLTLASENQQTGTVNMSDVLNALEKAQQAQGQLVEMQRVIDVDVTSLRQALGYGLGTVLTFSKRVHVPVSDVEGKDAATVSSEALAIAPEAKQLGEVLAAAGDAKWSAIFGFITGTSLNALPSSSGSSSSGLSGLAGSGTAAIGPAIGPTVQIAQDNIDAVQDQLSDDLPKTLDQEADSTLKNITAYGNEVQIFTDATKNAYEVYLSKAHDYSLGTDTLLDVLQAETDYFTSSGQRVQAQSSLDAARIALHRMMLTDQFAPTKIAGCAQNVQLDGGDSGPFGWINDLFHPSADRVTLDQMCKAPLPTAAASNPAPVPSVSVSPAPVAK